MSKQFLICRTPDASDLPLPQYMTRMAAGLDLYANVQGEMVIPAGKIQLVPTGIRIALPENYEAQIRPRSGLALRYGISMPNTPATIDADYRGELKVILINHGEADFTIRRGDRIAQMVIHQVERVQFIEVSELDDTERGDQGFGHTGIGEASEAGHA